MVSERMVKMRKIPAGLVAMVGQGRMVESDSMGRDVCGKQSDCHRIRSPVRCGGSFLILSPFEKWGRGGDVLIALGRGS